MKNYLANGLHKQKRVYLLLCMVLIATLTGYAILAKFAVSQEETLRKLQQVKTNLLVIRESDRTVRHTLARFEGLLPPEYEKSSPQRLLYAGLDGIGAHFDKADLTIGSIEENPEEVSAQFMIKTANTAYDKAIHTIGLIEASVLPIVDLTTISIAQQQDHERQIVALTVEGSVRVPRTAAPGNAN